jgi:hypothetical protein
MIKLSRILVFNREIKVGEKEEEICYPGCRGDHMEKRRE